MKPLLRKIKARIRRVLTTRPHTFDEVDGLASDHHCDLQYVMDIDPSSPWHSPGFVEKFGGFNPPGENRQRMPLHPGDRVRADALTLLLQQIIVQRVPGSMAELGVHRGVSARLIHHYCPERKLYLFDTFTGFKSEDVNRESTDVGFNRQMQFADTDVSAAQRTIGARNNNVILVPGWFPETVTPTIAAETFAFVHLDADLEAPTAAALDFFWPRLSAGGYIVVHDYNAWPGVRLAVDLFRTRERMAAVPLADKSGSIVLAKI